MLLRHLFAGLIILGCVRTPGALGAECNSSVFESSSFAFKLTLSADRWKCTYLEPRKADNSFEADAADIRNKAASAIIILEPAGAIHEDIRTWILDQETPNVLEVVYHDPRYKLLDHFEKPKHLKLGSGQDASVLQSRVEFYLNGTKVRHHIAVLYFGVRDGRWYYIFLYNPKDSADADLSADISLVAKNVQLATTTVPTE